MKKDLYNSKEEEHQHVINLLKQLPQVKAQENFEYNLRVRIENKNFTLNSENGREGGGWWKIAVPASVTTAAAIFLFTLFIDETENFENPLQIEPQPRIELSSSAIRSGAEYNKVDQTAVISENDVLLHQQKSPSMKSEVPVMAKEQPELMVETKSAKPEFPFDDSKSTDLDMVITQNQSRSKLDERTSLAGSSNPRNFFNGFFIGEEVNKEYVDMLKARNDSLMKVIKNRKKTLKEAE